MAKTDYKAPALDKGLDILELLSGNRAALSMGEIADRLGRSRNEIFRMVHVLEKRGYLERDESKDGYQLTNKLFELGMRFPPIANLSQAALPVMYDLASALGQSVQLVVLSGTQIVVIDRVENPGDMGFSVRPGYRRPMVLSSSGIVLYGFASIILQDQMLKTIQKDGATEVEVARFLEEVRIAKERGFVSHPSSFVEGITDICAPVFGANRQQPLASLTIPHVDGKEAKVTRDRTAKLVVEAADLISAQIRSGSR